MKDVNIKFNDNFLEERNIKNKRCLIFKGYLENNLECCPLCGCIESIKKNGTKTSLIKIPKVSELVSYLELKNKYINAKNVNIK